MGRLGKTAGKHFGSLVLFFLIQIYSFSTFANWGLRGSARTDNFAETLCDFVHKNSFALEACLVHFRNSTYVQEPGGRICRGSLPILNLKYAFNSLVLRMIAKIDRGQKCGN